MAYFFERDVVLVDEAEEVELLLLVDFVVFLGSIVFFYSWHGW